MSDATTGDFAVRLLLTIGRQRDEKVEQRIKQKTMGAARPTIALPLARCRTFSVSLNPDLFFLCVQPGASSPPPPPPLRGALPLLAAGTSESG